MTRIVANGGRWVAQLAVVACLLAPANARIADADGAVAPDAHADCARPAAGTPAISLAQPARGAVLSRPATGVAGPACRAPSRTRTPARAGLLVEVDPPAGELSPTTTGADGALPADSELGLARSTDGLELRMLPDGSRRVDLQGRFRAYSVVTIAADGTLRMACADDQAAALTLARAGPPQTPAGPAPRAAFGPREE